MLGQSRSRSCDSTQAIRYSLVAAFCHGRHAEIIDGGYVLIQLVHNIGARAEKHVVQELLGDIRAVHGKPRLLYSDHQFIPLIDRGLWHCDMAHIIVS